MEVTLSGIVMLVKAQQSENADLPMEVILLFSANVKVVKLVPINA